MPKMSLFHNEDIFIKITMLRDLLGLVIDEDGL